NLKAKAAKFLKPTVTKTPKKLASQHIEIEFGKTTFQSEVSANKRGSKTDNFEAIWTKETNNKPTPKTNEATRKL
ncbi:hypothetical protein, partial [Vibrio parahaemolyticus]|uniref:hypothetical protein n=1 Tax=Vibrio parahaemolyticus TaxID=670 RepID=UPI00116A3FF6